MTTVLIILIFLTQFLTGWGIFRHLTSSRKWLQVASISLLMGMAISTLTLFLLELLKIPLNLTTFLIAQIGTSVVFNLQFEKSLIKFKQVFAFKKIDFRIYNMIPHACIVALIAISAWRCYYIPITPFDTITGPDLVAKYAVMEGTLASTVFTEHLPSVWYWSNQPFYAPFTTLMQVIYKMAGLAFGKIWLSALLICFVLFFYSKLKETLHPLLASLLILIFLTIPEMYAYTFMVQTDFSNAVFFAIGIIFFYEYYLSQKRYRWKPLVVSIIFMAFATWTRSETIFFLPFGSLMILHKEYKSQNPAYSLRWGSLFTLIPLLFFLLWNFLYLKIYLPIAPDNAGKLKLDFANYFSELSSIMAQMNKAVVFNDIYWNYFVTFFIAYFILNLVIYRNTKGLVLVIWLLVLYFVFLLLLKHVSGVNIGATFRRGFFKFFPIMIFYMAHSTLFQYISKKVNKWEYS